MASAEGVMLILAIGDKQYDASRVDEHSVEVPVIWCLAPLDSPPLDDPDIDGIGDPYYVCRFADGTIQCDCADFAFGDKPVCKHWRALAGLGLI
jgi:hypothetical protein